MKHVLLVLGLTLTLLACSSTTSKGNAGGDAGTAGTGGSQCTAAREQLLPSVAKVSTAEVKVLSDAGGVLTIYVDASAGGFDRARVNPRVYITLAGTKVDVSDVDAPNSTDWDLALKRTLMFTNSGDGGKGQGGGAIVRKAFDALSAADIDPASLTAESFFDADCNAKKDIIGDAVTTFTGWYEYDQASNIPTPDKNVSFAVKSAAGETYVVGIASYSAKPDGSNGSGTGFYLLKVKKV